MSRKNDPVSFDADNPEWTEADFAKAKPAHEVLPSEVLANFKRMRGPQKSPLKQAVSIRLSPEVLEHFKAGGPGWQSRINETLKEVVRKAG